MTPIQRRKHAARIPAPSAAPAPLPLAAALMTGLAFASPLAAAAQDATTSASAAATGGPSADDQVRNGDEATIECVLHGSKFDVRDGRALNPPAYTPVAKFPVKVEDGAVWTRDDRG